MKKNFNFFVAAFIIIGNIYAIKADNINVSNFTDRYTYFSQFLETNSAIFDCGPAVLKMTLSGFRDVKELSYTDIRRDSSAGKTIMYVSEIKDGLTYYGVSYKLEKYVEDKTLVNILDTGKIAILCIDMGKIKCVKGQDNLFYGKNVESLNTGHFIILAGYKVEGNKLYFEVLDPYNKKIANQYIFEEVSYYEAKCLEEAITSWSNEVIVLENTNLN